MLEALLTSVLNKFLGDYVDNLETKQLSIGIWKGDVVLHNLRLRKEALDKFNLPIDVLEGFLGDLTLSIPWNDLKNKPVRVFINNVYLLAAPKTDGEYDPDLEEERAHKLKMDKIEASEMLSTKGKLPGGPQEDKQNSSLITQLVTKIVDNLQITIKNIHVRYEDRTGLGKGDHFSVGITLSELSAVSTDELWNEAYIHEELGIIHKLLRLGSLAVYWNTNAVSLKGKPLDEAIKTFSGLIASGSNIPDEHQYILKPVSGLGKVKLRKVPVEGQAKYQCNLQFDEFGFVLDDQQYSSLLSLTEAFSLYMRAQAYRKYRPPKTITPSIDPLAWFKYAGTCVLSEIHDRTRRWRWEYIAERRDDRILYIKLFKQSKVNPTSGLSPEDKMLLNQLERKLSYEDIRFYRSLANNQLKREKALQSSATIQPTVQQKTTVGWIADWWSGTPAAETTSKSVTTVSTITEDQMQQILETIDYDPKSALMDSVLPRDSVLWDFNWELGRGSFALKNNSNRSSDLISAVFEHFTANVLQYPSAFAGILQLGSMTVKDGTTENSLYPTLIQALPDANDTESSFFSLVFEHKPLDDRADDALSIRMLPLQVIVNMKAISAIIDFFARPAQSMGTISTLKTVAQDTLQGLTAQTRAGIEYAIAEHRTVDLKIDIAAPIFIIPESCSEVETNVLLVDAGHLLVESNLISKETKKHIEERQGSSLTPDDVLKLESLLYDRFTCKLSSVQALAGRSVSECLLEASNPSTQTSLHVLEKVDISFNIELCILPKLANHTKMAVAGKLPRLHINLSDRKYKTIMSIVDLLTKKQGADDKSIVATTTATALANAQPGYFAAADANDGDSFYDASESLESVSAAVAVDPVDKVLLRFSFEVNDFLVSLQRTEIDKSERTLAALHIVGFDLQMQQRPYDLGVQIQILSVSIEDKLQQTTDDNFKYLLRPSLAENSKNTTPLLLVEYTSLRTGSPEYQGVDQSVEISLASVDVMLIKESVLYLYDFLLKTFTSGPKGPPAELTDAVERSEPVQASVTAQNIMVVRLRMTGISFIVSQRNLKIATTKFDAGQLSITLKGDTMSVAGRLGNLSVVDEVLRPSIHEKFKTFLDIEGTEVADFTYDTFNQKSPTYPGYDSALKLRTSSVHITFVKPLIIDLMEYFSEFQQLHALLDSARRAAVQVAENTGRFHYDILMQTPIITFPHQSYSSTETITMYLGKISIKNGFRMEGELTINEMYTDIKSLKLVSNLLHDSSRMVQMIDDVDVSLQSSSTAEIVDGCPQSFTMATLNAIRLKLTKRQYFFVMETLGVISSVISRPPTEMNEDMNDEFANIMDDASRRTHLSDMHVVIPCISLEIFGDIDDGSDFQNSLAQFALNDVTYKSAAYSNGDGTVEYLIKSINLLDTRKQGGNLFREIIPPLVESDIQLSIRIERYAARGFSNYKACLDTLKLVFVIDHLYLVKDFFMKPLPTIAGEIRNVPDSEASPSAGEVTIVPQVNYWVSIVDVELVLLQDPKTEDCEAIVLTAKELVYSYNLVSTLSMLDVGMFFCSMDSRNDTTVRFIQNFTATVAMDNRITGPGHKLTSINIDISPLLLRVSYHDIFVINDIWNKIMELSKGPANLTDSSDVEQEINEIVMAREKVQITTQGIRVVLIDDLNDIQLPMFDFVVDKLVLEVADWSSLMRVDTGLKLHVNSFNVKNSHWEPLVEMFEFYLNISKQTSSNLTVDLYARRKLEVNISHVFVETMLNTMTLMSKQQTSRKSRSNAHSPYILRNRTGYKIHVWAESSGDGLDTEIQELDNNAEVPWRFDDWRVVRENISPSPNKLSVQIHGPEWETLKYIPVDREGCTTYMLRPSINRVVHRLICEVQIKNNVKIVTFRSSTVIYNLTNISVDVIVINSRGQRVGVPVCLGPSEEFPIPIESSYYDKILIRPQESFGYGWSNETLYWRDWQPDVKSPILVGCKSSDSSTAPFRFQVNIASTGQSQIYPSLSIKLLPPFQLENLLPFDIRYEIFDKSSRQETRGNLAEGAIESIHTVDPSHSLSLKIELLGTEYHLDFKPSELAILSNAELDYRDERVTLVDSEGLELHLRLKYSEKLEFGGRKVAIYAPYVLLNKTGLKMVYSARSLIATARLAAGQAMQKFNSEKVTPFLFSYTNFEPVRNRALVKVDDSDWSKPISFEAVGSSFDVTVPSSMGGKDAHIGVTITEGGGKYYLTKVVTFSPRFIVKNSMAEDLYCRQQASSQPILIKAGSSMPLYWFKEDEPKELFLRLAGLMDEWSSPFNINQIGRTFIKLSKMGTSEEDLLRAEIILEHATVFIMLSKEEGRWPFRIDNTAEVEESKNKYLILPGQSRPYAWDNPSLAKKALILHVNGREREIDVREIGQLLPFKYPIANNSNRTGIMTIQVYAEGPSLVVSLGTYVESKSVFRHGSNVRDSSEEAFQKKNKEASDLLTLQVRLEGIGISVISKDVKELFYASAKNLAFSYSDTTISQAISFSINWLQVDNQLYGSLEPIFIYPTVLPKEGEEDFHPVLLASLSKSKDASYGVDYYNWFTILLQEISIDLDEDFLFALINFAKFDVVGWTQLQKNVFFESLERIPEPKQVDGGEIRMYFEKFLLQPIQFNVSFQRTQSINVEETRGNAPNILTFLLDVFTMTVGNIHDAPIRLNALEIYHPIVTFSQLVDLMMKFYSQEVVGQLHKVIGSADVLGNPVGLFNNVSSGVRDFFYEPMQGFEITRPQDFGIGLAKGTTSLFKKTVYGVSDTLSKFTGSVSKGLSVFTLDEDFQEQRRLTSVRNRPRHAVYGVTAGATSLVTSVASGLTGVLSKPVEGFEKDGVGGFFKGLGKGLVGVVSKPLIGVFDLATNVSEGIKNTTTVFDKEIEKIRLPRHISRDGILTAYDAREALGLKWLKSIENGKYFHEEYYSHLELKLEDLVIFVTDKRVLMAKMSVGRTDWEIPFHELQLVFMDNGGITLIKKGKHQARARIIPCPDQPTAQ
ncbi:hypothetical protein HDV05_004781 [Chytridiales sp. JEL 0842]|nr:hypothetical protein HDV05_004781 [Chytridiales sp. JEL 0842]